MGRSGGVGRLSTNRRVLFSSRILRQDGMRALALVSVSASMHEVSRRCSSVGRAAVL
jgi:hypothetical protein